MTIKRLLLVLPLTFIMVGCNMHQQALGQQMPVQTAGFQPQYQPQAAFQQTPNYQQQAFAAQPTTDSYNQQLAALKAETSQEIAAMGERVRRVERAMIRLDRRMQVLERNELVKVSGLQENTGGVFGGGQFQPTAYPTAAPTSPFAHGASVLSRTPFAARGQVDTQELNSQHVSIAPLQPAQPYTGAAQAQPTGQRLASLADSHTQNDADTQVAIWTVNYDPRKIWPDRAELAASTDVVNALRSGRPVNVFARGARPSSKEFRERVRALSRYLGRVANLESVPISAMPADHLNTDTIELLVAN